MKYKLYNLLLALLFFGSCAENNNTQSITAYYPLRKVLQQEADENIKTGMGIIKEIHRATQDEKKIFQHPDWNSELRPFMDCDLNKPAFIKMYLTDSTQHGDTLDIIYTATEKKLQVRVLHIQLLNNELYKMHAEVSRSNSYFSLFESLDYTPHVSYSINGKQHTLLAGTNNYLINSQFAFIK